MGTAAGYCYFSAVCRRRLLKATMACGSSSPAYTLHAHDDAVYSRCHPHHTVSCTPAETWPRYESRCIIVPVKSRRHQRRQLCDINWRRLCGGRRRRRRWSRRAAQNAGRLSVLPAPEWCATHESKLTKARLLTSTKNRMTVFSHVQLRIGLFVKSSWLSIYAVRKNRRNYTAGKVTNKSAVVSCTLCAWPPHCWKTKNVHEKRSCW